MSQLSAQLSAQVQAPYVVVHSAVSKTQVIYKFDESTHLLTAVDQAKLFAAGADALLEVNSVLSASLYRSRYLVATALS